MLPVLINLKRTYRENGAKVLKRFLFTVYAQRNDTETLEFVLTKDSNNEYAFQRINAKKLKF